MNTPIQSPIASEVSSLNKHGLGTDKAKEKKLRDSCEGFESIFIQKMWEQMRSTVPKEGFMHGKEEKFWQGMYDQELSKKMSTAGGIGLADMMYEQLSRNLDTASRTTASARPSAFMAHAAPLLPQPVTKEKLTPPSVQPQLTAQDMYEKAEQKSEPKAPVAQKTVAEQSSTDPAILAALEGLRAQANQGQQTVIRTNFTSNNPNSSGRMRSPAPAPVANIRSLDLQGAHMSLTSSATQNLLAQQIMQEQKDKGQIVPDNLQQKTQGTQPPLDTATQLSQLQQAHLQSQIQGMQSLGAGGIPPLRPNM